MMNFECKTPGYTVTVAYNKRGRDIGYDVRNEYGVIVSKHEDHASALEAADAFNLVTFGGLS